MGTPTPRAFNSMYMGLAALAAAMTVSIIIIVEVKFWTFYTWYTSYSYAVADTCFLSTPNDDWNQCNFNWAMAGISLFTLLMAFFMAMCNRRPGKATPFLVVFLIAGMLLLALAIVDTIKLPDANTYYANAGLDTSLDDWRNALIGLSWAAFAVSLVAFIASVMDVKGNKPQPMPAQYVYDAQPGYGDGGYMGGAPPPQMYNQPPPGAYGYGAPPAPPPGGIPPPIQPGGYAPPTYYPAGPTV